MDRIINMIGVFSIVGSLIFVGLELRQSHTIALATQGTSPGGAAIR